MNTLLLRLAAPLQSWGADSKFDIRGTQREPTKSGVLGLLASALGLRRDDTKALRELAQLRFGVRVDREGHLLRDFHMAHGNRSDYVTHRYYLSDAVFLCGLASDDAELLQKYAYALTHPVFPLFLGRRSCPPTLPIVLGIRYCDLETALREEQRLVVSSEAIRMVLDVPAKDNTSAAVVNDVPMSFSPLRREFGYRKIREELITGMLQTGHDPFAEVEAEYVSDETGT
jgi:CRISPR system Cascade subunit CasD